MTDTSLSMKPTVASLVRERKIILAKLHLDLLMAPGDDETTNAICDPVWQREKEIDRALAELEPTNADELVGMIDVVISILEEASTEDECEIGILRAARRGAYALLDDWRRNQKAA